MMSYYLVVMCAVFVLEPAPMDPQKTAKLDKSYIGPVSYSQCRRAATAINNSGPMLTATCETEVEAAEAVR